MAARFCTRCGAPAAADAAFCARCGATLGDAGAAHPTLAPPPAAPPAAPGQPRLTQGVAIAGLLLNILVWPGLGSLIAGRNVGWAQGFLFLLGIPLALVLVGIPMMIGAWIWALVTGIQVVQQAS